MSRLTAAERRALPSSAFADPKNRRFPMNDANHARLAVSMAGHAGPKVRARIKAKAEKKGVEVSKGYVAEQFEPVLKRRGGQLSPDELRQRKEAARRRRHKVGRAGLTAAKVLVPMGLAVAGAHQQRKQHAQLLDSMRRSNETSEALLNATREWKHGRP